MKNLINAKRNFNYQKIWAKKKVELELRKVNIFIGEQAGGKSTLAKLVAIFKTQNLILGESNFKDIFSNYNILSYLKLSSKIEFKCNDYSIIIERMKFKISLNKSFKEKVRIRNIYREHIKEARENLNTLSVNQIVKTIKSFSNADSNLVKQSVYIPAERMLISMISNSLLNLLNNDIALPQFLIKFGSNFQLATNQMEKFDFPEFDLKYESIGSKSQIIHKAVKSKLEESSSGIQSLIPLLSILHHLNSKLDKMKMNFTFIIEEPELNLYPTFQKKLVEFIILNTTKYKNELIITTHSPYILTTISNLILAGDTLKNHPKLKNKINKLIPEKYHLNYDDVQTYYVERGTAHTIMDDEYRSIDASKIDDVSNELGEKFDQLLDLKYTK